MRSLLRLACVGFGICSSLIHSSAADEIDDRAVARFVEVVNLVQSDWKPNRPMNCQMAAKAAVRNSRDAGPGYPGMKFSDEIKMLIRAEAGRTRRAPFQVAEEATARFVDSLDPWSSFMNQGAWRQYQRSQSPRFAGVGMDIEKESEGHFTCWPYPGSPAAAAGIKAGAVLKAVDGAPVRGLSIFSVVSKVRGEAGQPVQISVGGMWGSTTTIHRRATRTQTVFTEQGKNGPKIQITRFATGTANELQKALKAVRSETVEIDLRGCRGGDLDEAVACTGSFLPGGTPVCLIQRNRKTETLRAPSGRQGAPPRVIILQDRETASSAELFIQALTSHRRATSVGGTTQGKGTTQTVMELSNGGALILTTGVLANPHSGQSWHNRGLPAAR